jgi:hypothetical protein
MNAQAFNCVLERLFCGRSFVAPALRNAAKVVTSDDLFKSFGRVDEGGP